MKKATKVILLLVIAVVCLCILGKFISLVNIGNSIGSPGISNNEYRTIPTSTQAYIYPTRISAYPTRVWPTLTPTEVYQCNSFDSIQIVKGMSYDGCFYGYIQRIISRRGINYYCFDKHYIRCVAVPTSIDEKFNVGDCVRYVGRISWTEGGLYKASYMLSMNHGFFPGYDDTIFEKDKICK